MTHPQPMNQNHSPQDIVVGLDIGTTKIACIVGQRNAHGKLEVIGYGRSESIGVTRGVVANIEHTVQSIRTAVEAAEKSANVRIEVVNVGIAGQHIKSLQHRGQLIRTETEDEINRSDVQQLIDDMKKCEVWNEGAPSCVKRPLTMPESMRQLETIRKAGVEKVGVQFFVQVSCHDVVAISFDC